jgi:hypothetical protein
MKNAGIHGLGIDDERKLMALIEKAMRRPILQGEEDSLRGMGVIPP